MAAAAAKTVAANGRTRLASLLEDSTEDLYENAPCGYLSTFPDGQIARVNATLLSWLGYTRGELVGRRYFSDLLTVGGRLYHETHFAPLLAMQGEIGGVALELQAADGTRLPVLVNSVGQDQPGRGAAADPHDDRRRPRPPRLRTRTAARTAGSRS